MRSKKLLLPFFFLGILIFNILNAGIIVDHNCTDVSLIPHDYLDSVRTLDIYFAHREIGDSIMVGIMELAAEDSSRYYIDTAYEPNIGWFSNHNGIAHDWSGLNCSPDHKCSTFNYTMREDLIATQVDITFFVFYVRDFICLDWWGEMPADTVWFNHYMPMMDSLEIDYPEVSFVWWTAPLNDRWGNEEKQVFNTHVRNYCIENDKILFDLAAIESRDPEGEMNVDVEGFEAMYPDYAFDGTFPNKLGQRRIASALWWLFAEITGWNGGIEEEHDTESEVEIELAVNWMPGAWDRIDYSLPAQSYVRLVVYDASGREVARPADGMQLSGRHSVDVNGLSPGVYFCRLQACGQAKTAKIIALE